jgi:positive regulator of sigma E activity
MRETGTVKSIRGRRMQVRLEQARPEVCRECRACEVLGEGREMVMHAPAVEGLAVGDRVTVELPETNPWVGIVLVLGLPVTLVALGLVLGSRWAWWVDLLHVDADLAGAALGVALGGAALAGASLVDRRYFRRVRVTRADGEER